MTESKTRPLCLMMSATVALAAGFSFPLQGRAADLDWLPPMEDSQTVVIRQSLERDALLDCQFHPRYMLPGEAATWLGPETGVIPVHQFSCDHYPQSFMGHRPTQRVCNLIPPAQLPTEEFSLEFWINDHVSRPIAFRLAARSPEAHLESSWTLSYDSRGYSYRRIRFEANTPDEEQVSITFSNTEKDGFMEYWRHVVIVNDGKQVRMVINGQVVGTTALSEDAIAYLEGAHLELAGYFAHEPYMELSNILRHLRIYNEEISQERIEANFAEFRRHVEEGLVFPGELHFNAGPYISFIEENAASIVWETDRPTRSTVSWGTRFPLTDSVELDEPGRIQRVRLTGLSPETPYFYRIVSRDQEDRKIDTGMLTFRTAPRPGNPFRFAVIGDTETRPHINHRLGSLMWDERPSFVVNLGDLTDGGKEPEKFQWNYEYFVGVTPLASRIPFITVPGNGEGDLYWYNQYHALPEGGTPYRFRYGDAEFFMMDSNQRKNEFAKGGRQYTWLQESLADSKAEWKFVAFHHAPYTSEANDYGDSWKGQSQLGDLNVRQLVPVFEEHGVDVVMFGHLHLYERTWPIREGRVQPGGVVYLLAGGGGGNLEDFAPNPAFFTSKTYRGHHYCMIEIFGDRLTLSMYDLDGDLRDQSALHRQVPELMTKRDDAPATR